MASPGPITYDVTVDTLLDFTGNGGFARFQLQSWPIGDAGGIASDPQLHCSNGALAGSPTLTGDVSGFCCREP